MEAVGFGLIGLSLSVAVTGIGGRYLFLFDVVDVDPADGYTWGAYPFTWPTDGVVGVSPAGTSLDTNLRMYLTLLFDLQYSSLLSPVPAHELSVAAPYTGTISEYMATTPGPKLNMLLGLGVGWWCLLGCAAGTMLFVY